MGLSTRDFLRRTLVLNCRKTLIKCGSSHLTAKSFKQMPEAFSVSKRSSHGLKPNLLKRSASKLLQLAQKSSVAALPVVSSSHFLSPPRLTVFLLEQNCHYQDIWTKRILPVRPKLVELDLLKARSYLFFFWNLSLYLRWNFHHWV